MGVEGDFKITANKSERRQVERCERGVAVDVKILTDERQAVQIDQSQHSVV